MITMSFKQASRAVLRIVALGVCLALSLPFPAYAAQLTQRSLQLGTTAAGAATTHTFTFTYTSTTTVGSVVIEYCDSPLEQIACSAPPGLDASAATLTSQSGETGFSILSQNANQIVLTRAPIPASNIASTYQFSNVVNPTGSPGTFYARIATYATIDGTGAETDFGAAVNSTTQGVSISTEVPPILDFCVGQSIPTDCSSANGDVVDLGVLRSNVAATGTSQFVTGTNAQFGLAVTANGTTLTSGNNTIGALNAPTASAPGNAQFGLNLRANTNPPVGSNPQGSGTANPTSQYNIVNRFVFHPGDVVAATSGTTDIRKFTVSYVANIPPSQPSGVYTATLTYICTASF